MIFLWLCVWVLENAPTDPHGLIGLPLPWAIGLFVCAAITVLEWHR